MVLLKLSEIIEVLWVGGCSGSRNLPHPGGPGAPPGKIFRWLVENLKVYTCVQFGSNLSSGLAAMNERIFFSLYKSYSDFGSGPGSGPTVDPRARK